MKLTLRSFSYLGILTTLLFTACSASKTATTSHSEKSQQEIKQPSAWYKNAKQFKKINSSYEATGISISTDSTIAIRKAEKQARAQLKYGIQNDLESLRSDLVNEEGHNALASRPDFIWIFRGAANSNLKSAKVEKKKVIAKNGIYQAYIKMKYSKKEVIADLMKALSHVKTYQEHVMKSKAYQNWVASDTTSEHSATM